MKENLFHIAKEYIDLIEKIEKTRVIGDGVIGDVFSVCRGKAD
jgi:hypothetical protein